MNQTIKVEYRIIPTILTPGTLDKVPEDAHGARITQINRTKSSLDTHADVEAYDLFVGEQINIEEALKSIENGTDKAYLTELKEKGYEDAVILALPYDKPWHQRSEIKIWPVGWKETVVSSNLELADLISKINTESKGNEPISLARFLRNYKENAQEQKENYGNSL